MAALFSSSWQHDMQAIFANESYKLSAEIMVANVGKMERKPINVSGSRRAHKLAAQCILLLAILRLRRTGDWSGDAPLSRNRKERTHPRSIHQRQLSFAASVRGQA